MIRAALEVGQRNKFFVICDNLRSLENIGSIFRTADALLVDKIYLCGISGKPPHPKISKTALGAEKTVPFEYVPQALRLVKEIKQEGFTIVALEVTKNSLPYDRYSPTFPLALIVGNEVRGISKSLLKSADVVISLPLLGKKESLNVAVAFGIAGFEINKFRGIKGRGKNA